MASLALSVPMYSSSNALARPLWPDPNCKLPNLTGNIQIKGVKYSLSGWTREYQKEGEDKRLVSIKATHPDDMKKFSAKQETPLSSNNDIPF